ncbi:MAG: hypothetical protein L3J31_09505 [Bacteroidales bacterium]|nr:hypothetical protein [Bacteroidales bacterium]
MSATSPDSFPFLCCMLKEYQGLATMEIYGIGVWIVGSRASVKGTKDKS